MSQVSRFAIDVPADLIAELAVGAEEPDEVRQRFGVPDETWEQLQRWQPFLTAVADKRAELEKSGVTFRTKSKLKAEMLSDQIFKRTMAPDAPLGGMLSALEHYVRVADLAPKQVVAQQGGMGTGFSITINLPGPAAPAKDIVVVENTPQPLPIYLQDKPVEELPK